MNKANKKKVNLSLILGILGFVAGIFLLFTESWLIGVFGSIASAGMAYKGYEDYNSLNEEK